MDNVVTILSRNFRKINFRIGHIFIRKKGYSLKKKKKKLLEHMLGGTNNTKIEWIMEKNEVGFPRKARGVLVI